MKKLSFGFSQCEKIQSRKMLRKIAFLGLFALSAASAFCAPAKISMKEIKSRNFSTFEVSESVRIFRVSFPNQYGTEIVGNLFVKKDAGGKSPAIVIGHPMGATKEQSSCVYASRLAERGFVTLAVDQIFWGESGGLPRHAIAPDLYAETFSAAVDFLGTREFVDREKIGVLGICGSGSFVISAAKIDPRMKAVATVSMYDIGKMRRSGLGNSVSVEQRKKTIENAAARRYAEFLGGEKSLVGGSPFSVDENSPQQQKASHEFYRGRGKFIPKGERWEDNTRSHEASNAKFMNFYPFNDIETISPRPMLFIVGEKAHSREFSEDAYKKAAEPKEFFVVENAGHFELYDKEEFLPIEKLADFFARNLK